MSATHLRDIAQIDGLLDRLAAAAASDNALSQLRDIRLIVDDEERTMMERLEAHLLAENLSEIDVSVIHGVDLDATRSGLAVSDIRLAVLSGQISTWETLLQ